MGRLSHLACTAFFLVGCVPALAAPSPSNGVVTTANIESTPLTYTSGPNTGTNQVAPDSSAPCNAATNPCDEFELLVQLPENYATLRPNDQLVLRIDWTNTTSDYDLVVLDEASNEVGRSVNFLTNTEEVRIPAGQGTRSLRIRTNFSLVSSESYAGTVFIAPAATGGGLEGAPPDAGVRGDFATPRFHLYHSPQGRGIRAGEPTLFKNFNSPNTMFIAVLETLRVNFDDTTSPARDTWSLHSPLNGTLQSLDPILWGDEATGRVLSSQLTGANSLMSYSDDDGETWTPAQIAPPNGGADHQSVGGGPYGPDTLPGLPGLLYPNAIYYCSQSVAVAFCARSDDGGLTFGPGVPMYDITKCFGLHGHVKVGPDGTVYVPNKSCLDDRGPTLLVDGKPAVVVSTDSGVTWAVRTVPTGTGGGGVDDPSVAIASDGTVYLAYLEVSGRVKVAMSRDRGVTWQNDQDVGFQAGVRHIAFPAIVAGDPDRAAVFFLGTTTQGNYADPAFEGVWYPYVAYTQNGGQTWVTEKVSEDLVQRNGVCGGGACRNLLDFNDAVIDENGFLQLGYADGCVGSCEVIGPNSFQSQAVIARQSGGPGLYAANDPVEPTLPKSPRVTGFRTAQFVHLEWPATDNGGAPIESYNIYRSVDGGAMELLNSTVKLSYDDASADDESADYSYQVSAVNSEGEGVKSAALALAVGDNVPANRSVCTLPGITALIDQPNGDEHDAPITTAATDILEVLAAEPENTENLAFTLRMRSFTQAEPLTQYTVRFGVESGVHESSSHYYVRLDNGDTGGARTVYGYLDAVGALVEVGELPDAAEVLPGEIRFQIPKSLIGNPPVGTPISQVFATVSLINPTTGLPAGVPGAASPYLRDRAGFGRYTLVGNDFCERGALLIPAVEVPPPVVENPVAAPAAVTRARFGGAFALGLLLPLTAAALGGRRRRL